MGEGPVGGEEADRGRGQHSLSANNIHPSSPNTPVSLGQDTGRGRRTSKVCSPLTPTVVLKRLAPSLTSSSSLVVCFLK